MDVGTLTIAARRQLAELRDRVRSSERAWRPRLAAAASAGVALAVIGVSVPAPAPASHTRPVPVAPPGSGAVVGSAVPGRAGAEASAIKLVGALGGLRVSAGDRPDPNNATSLFDLVAALSPVCPAFRLRVSWTAPVGNYTIGAYVTPLGPPPTDDTRQVNGVVLCQGSTYAYLGFEAAWDGARWTVTAVPASSDDDHTRLRGDDTAPGLVPAAAPTLAAVAADEPGATVTAGSGWGPAIEPLAPYVPQATCDPLAKPGVVGFRDLVLHSFPGSRDLGIGQACDAPDGVSEHKEGRAFDFGVRVDDPGERAMAEHLLAWLFAPDQFGNQYAMIRRLGIMYIIWDRHIWGAYKADEGWRPYEGVSPHTDHIHLSFSWAGALGQTSFWTGHVGDVGLVAATPGAVPPHDQPAPGDGLAAAPPPPPATEPAPVAAPSDTGAASATGPSSPAPTTPASPAPPGSSPSSTTTTTTTPPPTTPPTPTPLPTTVPTVPHFP